MLEDTKGLGQHSVLCEYLPFVCLFGCEASVFVYIFCRLEPSGPRISFMKVRHSNIA